MMIKSLLDTDLYKLTMMQFAWSQYPETTVKYEFKCRNKDIKLSHLFGTLYGEIHSLSTLKFTEEELNYLSTLPYMKPAFIQFLKSFQLDSSHVKITTNEKEIIITIEGGWYNTILWEVPVLAIVNEWYFRDYYGYDQKAINNTIIDGRGKLIEKVAKLMDLKDCNFKFVDFGTRRRFSGDWQYEVDTTLKYYLPNNFVGTSNVKNAQLLDLTPIGTKAHEIYQAFQVLSPIQHFQKSCLDEWMLYYRGWLGTALTDVVGFDCFLRDFDYLSALAYTGCRHDSGDPYEWCNKLIRHYESLNIDPMEKTAVFSDGLTIDSAIDLYQTFKNKIKMSFGIGTSLTNDFDHKPLNIVIKMVECNGFPVAKLSDSPGKEMCKDNEYLTYLKKIVSK